MATSDPLSNGDIYSRISKLLDATSDANNADGKMSGEDLFGGKSSGKADDSGDSDRLDYLVYSPPSDMGSKLRDTSLDSSLCSMSSEASMGSSGMGTPGQQQRSISYSSYLNMPAYMTPPMSRSASPAPITFEGMTAAQLSALAPFGFQPIQTLMGAGIPFQNYPAACNSPPPTPDAYSAAPSPSPSTISNSSMQHTSGFDRRQLPMTPVGPTLNGPPLSSIDLGMANLMINPELEKMGLAPPGFAPTMGNQTGFISNMNNDLTWSGLSQMYGWDQELIELERRANERDDSEPVEPTYTWSGQLPPRNYKNPIYSNKVFLGGVPWDVTEVGLQQAFRPFGPVKVEWPGKETSRVQRNPPKGKGYCYLIFESEKSVKSLLANCTHDFSSGGDWYYKISSRRMRCKEVQVIPWVLSDSNFVKSASQKLDPNRTVFVGGLHGMINAEALCQIMKDLFDNVIYAGIDTDKHKYPIGSGRVTFSNHRSFMKAVQAAFIEIRSSKFTKKVQIDPYLEDSMCSTCHVNPGPFFCRDPLCFRYFCHSCWGWHHSIENLRMHKPMTRHSKTGSGQMFV